MSAIKNLCDPGFSWNIQCHNHQIGSDFRRHIDEFLARLRNTLRGLPRDSVHLLISLTRMELDPTRHEAVLVLRVPSHMIRTVAWWPNDIGAFARASVKLQSQLVRMSVVIRFYGFGGRAEEERRAVPNHAFGITPLPMGAGPSELDEVVRFQIERLVPDLRRYLARQLLLTPRTGEIAPSIPANAAAEAESEVLTRALQPPYPLGKPIRSWLCEIADEVVAEIIRTRNSEKPNS